MSIINVDYPNRTTPQFGSGQNQENPLSKAGTNFDLFDLLKRKFWLILFFVLLGLALSMLYFLKVPPTYESNAKIFVDEKYAPMMNSDSESFMGENSTEKYMEILKSSKILGPAIESGKFHELDTFSETKDILFNLREGNSFIAMPADSKSNSGVIKLVFQGPDSAECQLVLDSVVQSFNNHITSTTKNVGGETAKLVESVKEQMLTRLREVDSEIAVLAANPELLNIDGRIVNPHQMQLNLMHQDLHDIRRERTKLAARVDNIVKNQAAGKPLKDLIVEVLRESSEDSLGAYVSTHNQFVELKVKEQELLNQFGPDHPDVKQIQKQIAMVDGMRIQELSSLRSGGQDVDDESDIIKNFISQLNQKIAILQSEERSINESIIKEQEESASISALVEKLSSLQRERERLEQGCSAILERLTELNTLKEHLWRNLSVLDPPSVGEKVAPSLPISAAAGLFLGSLMGLAFAGFKDMAERTFRSSDDVATMLNTRVVGHINYFQKVRPNKKSSQFPSVMPEVITIHAPASQSSEAYRAIRTAIFFRAQESGAKVIQITSPTPGDGKSTTISNLAASIAQTGQRVLLLDADMRKPVQHKLFGISNSIGLSSIISGEVEPEEAIQVVQPEYLSVVASGPHPGNPAELLTSSRFAAIIETYRQQFDFVLIDSPPMLAVTDPSIICNHVDLVYMVMRIRNGVRTNSARAKEIIDSMGIEMGGIIINGIRRSDHKNYEYYGRQDYGKYTYGNDRQSVNGAKQVSKIPSGGPASRV